MRKVIFSVANSADNYIAGKDLSLDWILSDEEASSAMAELWGRIDTVVVGRKTYEPVLRSGKALPSYPGVKTYVFSRTLEVGSDENVGVISADAVEFIRKLKGEAGKDIFVMGGGELAKSLLEANVVDEIRLKIHPVLLGSGVPLFPAMAGRVDLELAGCKSYKNGCVYVRYLVKR